MPAPKWCHKLWITVVPYCGLIRFINVENKKVRIWSDNRFITCACIIWHNHDSSKLNKRFVKANLGPLKNRSESRTVEMRLICKIVTCKSTADKDAKSPLSFAAFETADMLLADGSRNFNS